MAPTALTKTESQQSKKIKPAAGSKPILNWLQKKIAGTVRGRSTRKGPTISRRVVSLGELRSTRNVSIDVSSIPGSPVAGSRHSSSLAPGSFWSPTNPIEADDDASTRPLPPTSPPSPAPSRSSSSYLSDPRTFRSMAASTKPTTVLSIDVGAGANMMAHIAQAPVTPTTRQVRPTHSPSTSVSVAFSPLAAPVHTTHHPRNNPRPSSPPPDNASMLTLASSAYAHTGRVPPWQGAETDSVSNVYVADSTVEDIQTFEDFDASVRALRPRSERRASWESVRSDWSGPLLNGSVTGSTMAIGKPRSERTAPSWKTGPMTDDWTHETIGDDASVVDVVINPPEDVSEVFPVTDPTPKHGEPFTPARATRMSDAPSEVTLPDTVTDDHGTKTPPFVPVDGPQTTPKKGVAGYENDS